MNINSPVIITFVMARTSEKLISIVGVTFLLLLFSACARDKTTPETPGAKPVEILLTFQTRADFSASLYYFFVFNFSNAPKRDEDSRPWAFVSGPDRGKNWERYVVFNGNAPTTSPTVLRTLTREDLPKLTPVGRGPVDVLSQDLNNDTYPDLVVVNSNDDTVSILLNNKDGTFSAKVDYTVGDEPSRLAIFDYENDGDYDLAVTNFADTEEGRSIQVLLNDGSGVFENGPKIQLPAQPLGIAQADFNNDDKVDLAVTIFTDSEVGNAIAIILKGEEGFGKPLFLPVGKTPVDVVANDYEGDGIIDLFVVNGFDGEGGNSISVLRGSGDGLFTPVFENPLPTGRAPASIAVARLNDDSFADIAVANSFNGDLGNSISIFLSNADGTYSHATSLQVGLSPTYVIFFDLNRDTNPELIVTESGSNSIRRFLGQGDGQFTEPVSAPTGSLPIRSAIIDYDQNELQDLAVVNSLDGSGGNSITILDGTTDSVFRGAVLYWTDEIPRAIVNEPWFRGINVDRNSIQLKIDPVQFTDLLGREPSQFLVDFMVATTGIDKETNPEDFGRVLDWLGKPVVVDVKIGFNIDESREQLENVENAPGSVPEEADIVDWRVEVS